MNSTALESIDQAADERSAFGFASILRDIAVGGLAALIVGTLIGGIGGRIVMRLAALVVPSAAGLQTDSGNVIGAVTLEGSLVLLLFGGLLAGVVAASVWVIARPWLPASIRGRILISMPLVLAVGLPLVIDARNPDFALLGYHPLVVGALVVLVAVVGPVVVLLDDWLARRLPKAGSGNRLAMAIYASVSAVGLLMTFALTVPVLMELVAKGVVIGLIVVGLATLVIWGYRAGGRAQPAWIAPVARSGLAVAIIVGLGAGLIQIAGALGRA